MAKKHLQHIKSSQANKIPTAADLMYGEIAVNYANGSEQLFIKNSNDEIVPFVSGKVIEENELVIAAALTQLNDEKADKEDLDLKADKTDIDELEQVIESNELVTSGALNYLNGQVESISSSVQDVQTNVGQLSDDIESIEEELMNYTNMESITYRELCIKANGNELIPGRYYRITDYETLTNTMDNCAGHQFDVIVLALTTNSLSENAHAAKHADDTYFDDCDLSSWQLKYSLENDIEKFDWAATDRGSSLRLYGAGAYDEALPAGTAHLDSVDWYEYIGIIDYNGQTYYAWRKYEYSGNSTSISPYVILTETLYKPGDLNRGTNDISDGTVRPFNGVSADVEYTVTIDYDVSVVYNGLRKSDEYICECVYAKASSNESYAGINTGKGVIYYMKDEWGNECPYDFKNIMFNRELTDGQLDTDNGTDTLVYTFNYWDSENDTCMDASIIGNTLKNDDGFVNGVYGNIINAVNYYYYYYYELSGQGTPKLRLTLPNNVFLTYKDNSNFYYGCMNNIFGINSHTNTFGNDCQSNTFGNDCDNNTFGNDCQSNTFGSNCKNNTFGNDCQSNKFGNDCQSNIFGNHCSVNILSNVCSGNRFGQNSDGNTFGRVCRLNTFGNDCQYNTFGNNCENNTFGNNCWSNTFENDCRFNTFGTYCRYNIFEQSCNAISFLKDATYYVTVENGNKYIQITSTQTTSYPNSILRNFKIAQGVNNTETIKNISHDTINDTFMTVYQPANSSTVPI